MYVRKCVHCPMCGEDVRVTCMCGMGVQVLREWFVRIYVNSPHTELELYLDV